MLMVWGVLCEGMGDIPPSVSVSTGGLNPYSMNLNGIHK